MKGPAAQREMHVRFWQCALKARIICGGGYRVPYRGNVAALPDLVSGQIDLMFSEQSNILGNLRAGTIRAYAILASERSAALSEVPTIEEAGGPPLHIVTWRGMWVP